MMKFFIFSFFGNFLALIEPDPRARLNLGSKQQFVVMEKYWLIENACNTSFNELDWLNEHDWLKKLVIHCVAEHDWLKKLITSCVAEQEYLFSP